MLSRSIMGTLALATLLVAPRVCALDPEAGDYDWGFVASSFKDVNGNQQFRAAGPFLERTRSTSDQTFLAVRPVYARLADPAANRTNQEILWPVARTTALREMLGWRVLIAIYLNSDREDPTSRSRFWVFPLFFQGRDRLGQPYLALFPVGGTIHEFLTMDEIAFVLFPLWARNSISDIHSQHWFWPIYARTRSEEINRTRVFPLYGQSQYRDLYRKKFVLWPIWTSAVYTYPTSNGSGYMLFPLWGHVALNDEETWWVLPPLFKFGKSDRQETLHGPWPIVQHQKGEVEKVGLFPIWGKKLMPGSYKSYFLWPIFHRRQVDKGETVHRQFTALPFVHSETYRERDPRTVPRNRSRFVRVWPLFSYQRELEVSRFRTLELWPSRRNGAIQRNYAPFWTLYTHTRADDHTQSELLWGLYRHHHKAGQERYLSIFPLVDYHARQQEEENRSFSILKGLIGYKRSGEVKSFRLLYLIRWGGKESSP